MKSRRINIILILLVAGTLTCTAQTAEDYVNEALKKYNDSNYTGALEDLKKAIEIDPGYAFGYYGMAWAYDQLGQYDLAGENFVKAFTLKPESFSFINYLNSGYECLIQRQYESCVSIYSIAFKLFPVSETFCTNLGISYLHLHKLDSAEVYFTKVTKFSSFYSDAWYYLGLINYLRNKYETAIEQFQKAEKWYPQHKDLLWRKAFAYIHLKLYDIAVIELNKSIKGKDTLFMPYLGLAAIYSELNDPVKSKENLDKAVLLNPLLKTGMEGIKILEESGSFFNEDDKKILAILFDKVK